MRSQNEHDDLGDPSTLRELKVLSEVEANPSITQRDLSRRVGVALGLTNVLIRNLVQKGYVRAHQTHWKRWLYAVTPEGFTHKIKLTVSYVNRVLDHYASVRHTLREQLRPLALHQESRVAIFGTGEIAELIYLGLREIDIDEIDIFTTVENYDAKFLGMKVQHVSTLKSHKYDKVVIASLSESKDAFVLLMETGLEPDKVVSMFEDVNSEGER